MRMKGMDAAERMYGFLIMILFSLTQLREAVENKFQQTVILK